MIDEALGHLSDFSKLKALMNLTAGITCYYFYLVDKNLVVQSMESLGGLEFILFKCDLI